VLSVTVKNAAAPTCVTVAVTGEAAPFFAETVIFATERADFFEKNQRKNFV